MITRRKLVAALAAGTVPLAPAVFSQQMRKVPLIGYLHSGISATPMSVTTMTTVREGLSAAGYVDGKTIRIEIRWANGKPDTLPGLAQELVHMKVDLLVATGPATLSAARAATASIPIVAHDLETDPVAAKLATSLARPSGNVTGLFLNHAELSAKWLQMLLETTPGAKRVAVLWDANTGPYQRTAITGVQIHSRTEALDEGDGTRSGPIALDAALVNEKRGNRAMDDLQYRRE